jgi:hypothetical protein
MVKPEHIGEITERSVQYDFPVATGAILHEAFHARFSRWDLAKAHDDLASDEAQALVLLEETRIERRGIECDPSSRVFLRASAMSLAIGDIEAIKNETATRTLATVVALVHGRVMAGILELDEVEEVLATTNETLGEDLVRELSLILSKFQTHDNDTDITACYDLAREWARLVRETEQERGECQGEGEIGEGGNPDDAAAAVAAVMSALDNAAGEVESGNYNDLADQQKQEDWQKEVKERAAGAKERKKHADTAKEVFGRGTGPSHSDLTFSRLVETRKPRSNERTAAVIISRLLEKAKYRDRDRTEVNSVLPPGRLRTRAIVQGAALRERGVATPVEAFRKVVRKQTDEPTLTVGVMVDISGSMGSAMEPMATTAWVMSEATRRVQGKAAMVYFGQSVFPTLRAGQHLDDVQVYSAPDGTEKFDQAFTALDGELNLLHGSGARLLVVASDGCYTGSETEKARKWLARCQEAGVAILWLPFDNGYYARTLISAARGSARLVPNTMDPAVVAGEIGKAAAEALEAIGRRNAAA